MNDENVVAPEPQDYEAVVEPVAVESIVVESEPAPSAPEPSPFVYVPEPEPEVFTTPEVQEEPEVVVMPVPAAAESKAKSKKVADAAPDTFADDDIVFLSSLKFQAVSRNSRSVYLVQERLYQLGFDGGYEDQPGWLSDGTRRALAEFCPCDESSVRVDDEELIKRLFAGTSVKVVVQ